MTKIADPKVREVIGERVRFQVDAANDRRARMESIETAMSDLKQALERERIAMIEATDLATGNAALLGASVRWDGTALRAHDMPSKMGDERTETYPLVKEAAE